MPSQTPETQRENSREARALEREHRHEQADGCGAGGVHGRDGEDEAECQEGEEDQARLGVGRHHGEAGDEAHAGVDALGGGEEGGGVGGGAADLFAELDEVVGDGDLGADVAELGESAEEKVFSVRCELVSC
jgi:hypothetical protein